MTARNFCFGIVRVQINVGNTPPSASQRPMSEPSGPSGIAPRGLAAFDREGRVFPATATAPARLCATSRKPTDCAGRATVTETSLLPLPSSRWLADLPDRRNAGEQSAAPHSSQYRDPPGLGTASFAVDHCKTRPAGVGTTKARAEYLIAKQLARQRVASGITLFTSKRKRHARACIKIGDNPHFSRILKPAAGVSS